MKSVMYKGQKYVLAADKATEWFIPVTVTTSGHLTVTAKNFKEAVQLAREKYSKVGYNGLEMTSVDVDFCENETEYNDYAEDKP